MPKFSQRSLNNLAQVHPDLRAVAEMAIAETAQDFTVVEGARSVEQQRKNVANGVSKTMNSKHLVQPDGWAWAFDAYPYYGGSVQVNAGIDKFKIVADTMQRAADKLGVKITRGYDWGWDAPHFELVAPRATNTAGEPAQQADFSIAYAPVKQWEGGWCDVPGDPGGETYAGITKVFAPEWPGWRIVDSAKSRPEFKAGASAFSKYLATIPELTKYVEDWYRTEWWDKMKIAQYPQVVANELFEQAINLGRGGSGKLVQMVCNAFNWKRGKNGEDTRLFDDLTLDGVLGKASLAAIATILKERCSPEVFVHQLNCMQGYHYNSIAAGALQKRKFISGWEKRTYDEWALYPEKK